MRDLPFVRMYILLLLAGFLFLSAFLNVCSVHARDNSFGCVFERLGYDFNEEITDYQDFHMRVGQMFVSQQMYPEAVVCYEWLSKQLKNYLDNNTDDREYGKLLTGVRTNVRVLRGFLPSIKSQLFGDDESNKNFVESDETGSQLSVTRDGDNHNMSAVFKEILESQCPFALLGHADVNTVDPVAIANAATDILVKDGKLLAALSCFKWAHQTLKREGKKQKVDVSAVLQTLQTNVDSIENMLSGLSSNHVRRRLFHNSSGTTYPSEDLPVRRRKTHFIKYFDNALTDYQCQAVIDLFESSRLYEGNIIRNGKVVVDSDGKKNSEFDISGTIDSKAWATVELALLSITTKYLFKYERLNPVIRSLPSPLGDEGFRMKRYKNDGTEHHSYHIDSGTDLSCKPRRVIAMIMYLNEVIEGGETVFLNHGLKVKPKCGRIVLFPTDYTIIHAGRRPVSNTKYNIINFLTY
jgi:prolyl 4-hydroxylase